jgi:hypothetical protein
VEDEVNVEEDVGEDQEENAQSGEETNADDNDLVG